jgi:hypothetical protein
MTQESVSDPKNRRFDFQALISRGKEIREKLRLLPRSRRYAVISVVLLLALVGAYMFSPNNSAQLRIVCQHNFRSAQLTVRVNGKLACQTTLTGSTRKHFGLLSTGSVGGSYSTLANVPAGKELVEVHVNAPAEGFDEARALEANLREGEVNLLAISTSRGSLVLKSPGSTPATVASASDSRGFSMSLFSVLFSALGTMFSASISFMVQEFWKAHKNRANGQG